MQSSTLAKKMSLYAVQLSLTSSPAYNHGQKSWDTFAFLGRFPIHTGPTPPPPPHKQCWTRISRIFFRVSTLYRVGRRENCEKVSKRMHRFKREPRNDRNIRILQYCPKDFCPGISESWFWEKSPFSSFFLRFLGILKTSR